MKVLLVVERPEDWPLRVPGIELAPARRYLTEPEYSGRRGVTVYNLCRSYRYQSLGYYVSLLATARGHKPLPSVATIQDLKSRGFIRYVSEELDGLIQRNLAPLVTDDFTLSIYFGRNIAKRYDRLARQLFNVFPAPLLRAQFARHPDDAKWELQSLRPIAAKDIPPQHQGFVVEVASEHFSRPRRSSRREPSRYDLAILVNPEEPEPPSNERAIQRFIRAAERLRIDAETVTRDDAGRIAEYDALFLRETTQVNHHTYRIARRAVAEGLVVVDDPDSILRCGNKVYLAELLARARIPRPRTAVVHRDNVETAAEQLGFPCILKLPDSSFSQGVVRADDRDAFVEQARRFLDDSDLLIAQEFLPTDFDWRVGVLDRKILYACKYHMAGSHWQIIERGPGGRSRYGPVEAVPLEEAPDAVLQLALAAANLIGDGLYGVDVKEREGASYVIEINDNPSLDAGQEDGVLGDELYDRILRYFLDRLERRTEARRQ